MCDGVKGRRSRKGREGKQPEALLAERTGRTGKATEQGSSLYRVQPQDGPQEMERN